MLINMAARQQADNAWLPLAGMPTAQAQALLQYLRANPEMAKQVHEQANKMLKNPGDNKTLAQAGASPISTRSQHGKPLV